MEAALKQKDSRLYVRCKTLQKKLIEQAAAALGMSVSDYILATMIERSVSEIQRQNRLIIDQTAFAQLQELMTADPGPSDPLSENMTRYRQALAAGELTIAD
jgi:uncharacterized protein (DUF1778 family)